MSLPLVSTVRCDTSNLHLVTALLSGPKWLLQAYVIKLYRNAGLKGASPHTGRRSFASRLIYRGATVEEVRLLLGHASIDDSFRYIEPSVAITRRACEEVI